MEKGIMKLFKWSIVSSLGSASVMILAFLLPGYQAQKDRLASLEVVEHYERVANQFYEKQNFSEAERAFEHAFEASESTRLDLDMMRLRARVFKVHEFEDWKISNVENLEAGDFLFLLEMESDPEARSEYLGAYGVFLALKGKKAASIKILEEAFKLDPKNTTNLINLGNAYYDSGLAKKSEETYMLANNSLI